MGPTKRIGIMCWCRELHDRWGIGTKDLRKFFLPFLELVGCGDPGSPANGHKIGTEFWSGKVVMFACDPGYHLEGPSSRLCLAQGNWSDTMPTCKLLSCSIFFWDSPSSPNFVLFSTKNWNFLSWPPFQIDNVRGFRNMWRHTRGRRRVWNHVWTNQLG